MTLSTRALLLAASTFLVFGQALWFDFLWDDYLFLVDNESVKSMKNIPSFFVETTADLYRPLRTTLYAVFYQLFGLNPAPYHALGLLLNLISAFLLMRIFELCGLDKRASFFGALVFSVHPVHIQKIIFIASVFDMPGDVCFLAAVYFYLLYRDGGGKSRFKISIIFFGVALFFAETAVVFPFIVLMLELILFKPPKEKKFFTSSRLRDAAVIATVLIGYMVIRTYVVGRVQRPDAEIDIISLYMNMPSVYMEYFRLLVFPFPLSPLPLLEVLDNPITLPTLFSLLLLVLFIGAGWAIRKEKPLVSVGIFWFFIALLPNSNIIPTGTMMSERYLYLPSAGFCLLAGLFISGGGRKAVREIFLGIFILYLSALSIYQLPVWRNPESLWKHALKVLPNNLLALRNLAAHYKRTGEAEKAKALYIEMAQKGSHREFALSELSAYAIDDGNYALAENLILPLLRLTPGNEGLKKNLLIARCQLNRQGWKDMAKDVLSVYPEARLYEEVGNCYANIGEGGEAVKHFKHSMEIDPENKSARDKIIKLGG